MGIIETVICTVVISICTSICAVAIVWHELTKKRREEVGMLKAQIANMQQRWIWLEERYAKHEAKYHQ